MRITERYLNHVLKPLTILTIRCHNGRKKSRKIGKQTFSLSSHTIVQFVYFYCEGGKLASGKHKKKTTTLRDCCTWRHRHRHRSIDCRNSYRRGRMQYLPIVWYQDHILLDARPRLSQIMIRMRSRKSDGKITMNKNGKDLSTLTCRLSASYIFIIIIIL